MLQTEEKCHSLCKLGSKWKCESPFIWNWTLVRFAQCVCAIRPWSKPKTGKVFVFFSLVVNYTNWCEIYRLFQPNYLLDSPGVKTSKSVSLHTHLISSDRPGVEVLSYPLHNNFALSFFPKIRNQGTKNDAVKLLQHWLSAGRWNSVRSGCLSHSVRTSNRSKM